MATDYYGVLGLAQGASDSDIKRAYRRKARDLHPDVNPDPEAQEKFKAVTNAYEVLSDPQKRQVVDLGGDPLSSGPGSAGSPFTGGFGGLGDIIIDNASEDGGKIVLDDIDSPKKYAELMLRQMRQLDR